MKAVVCNAFGEPDQLQGTSVDEPVCGAEDALVQIAAAGVNFPDVLLVQGLYQPNHRCRLYRVWNSVVIFLKWGRTTPDCRQAIGLLACPQILALTPSV